MRAQRRGLKGQPPLADKENSCGNVEFSAEKPARATVAESSRPGSPELRRKLHTARSSFRDLQFKHSRALQELKDTRVKRMIKEAIERNEVGHLQTQLKQRSEELNQRDRELVQKQEMIKSLKGRIGALSRTQGRARRFGDESSALSEIDASRLESPRPRARADAAALSSRLAAQWPSAQVPVVAVDSSPRSFATPISQLSVENVVDCANNKLECLLAQGNEVLQRVDANHLSVLSETVTDHNMSHLSIFPEERTPAHTVRSTDLSPAHMIPFLEKTSNDLREAEAQVQRLDSDLASYEEFQLREESSYSSAKEPSELRFYDSCHSEVSGRSRATSPRLSVPHSARSVTPFSEGRSLVYPRASHVAPNGATHVSPNGPMMVKVGEYITERWVVVGDRGCGQQYEGHAPVYPAQPQGQYEMAAPVYPGQYGL